MKIGELFSGCGGLGMGVQAVLGGDIAWHSEIDPGACKILRHRYPDVLNLGDITAVDWSMVEPVDVLTGGFPCQDVSHAGKRAGMRPDTRSGLWSQMAYAIDQLRPRLVVAENVRGLLSAEAASDVEPCPWCVGDTGHVLLRALGAVLGDLADLGYDAAWHGLSASDVGAPHGRFRVFVVAWPAADADGRQRAGRERDPQRRPVGRVPVAGAGGGDHRGQVAADTERRGRDGRPGTPWQGRWLQPAHSGHPATDTSSDGRHEGWPEPARLIGGSDAALSGDAPADTPSAERGGTEPGHLGASLGRTAEPGERLGTDWGPYGPAIRRWETVLERSAPPPTEPARNGSPRLAPTFVEWMMGLSPGWVTQVPGITRNEALKALGNGVVPQQATAALRTLAGIR